MVIDDATARGRTIAAARMLAGLGQAELAARAKLSPSTISNVEAGHEARDESISAIRKALRKLGVTLTTDKANGLAMVAIRYDEPGEEE